MPHYSDVAIMFSKALSIPAGHLCVNTASQYQEAQHNHNYLILAMSVMSKAAVTVSRNSLSPPFSRNLCRHLLDISAWILQASIRRLSTITIIWSSPCQLCRKQLSQSAEIRCRRHFPDEQQHFSSPQPLVLRHDRILRHINQESHAIASFCWHFTANIVKK